MEFTSSSDQPTPARSHAGVGLPLAHERSSSRGCPRGRIGFVAGAFGAALVIIIGDTLAACAWGQETKDPQPMRGRQTELEQLVDEAKRGPERHNGVLLRAKVAIEPSDEGDMIVLRWSLDYEGPRQPLTILRPSLQWPAYKQTYVVFYAINREGKAFLVPVHAPLLGRFAPYVRDYFVEVKKGQTATGVLPVITVRALERAVRQKWPEQFKDARPERLFVRLHHTPDQRGEMVHRRVYEPEELIEFEDLDAWTGRLQTEAIEISFTVKTQRSVTCHVGRKSPRIQDIDEFLQFRKKMLAIPRSGLVECRNPV